jgi:hypothetical protein
VDVDVPPITVTLNRFFQLDWQLLELFPNATFQYKYGQRILASWG